MVSRRQSLFTCGALLAAFALLVPATVQAQDTTAATTVPADGTLTAVTANAVDYNTVNVGWTVLDDVPDDEGPLTGFVVYYAKGDGTAFDRANALGSVSAAATATMVAVNGLEDETQYTFMAAAVNAAGTGAVATAATPDATTLKAPAPAPPTEVEVMGGDEMLTVTWNTPYAGAPDLSIKHYMVRKREVKLGSSGSWQPNTNGKMFAKSPAEFEDLMNDVSYEVEVRAVNNHDEMSPWSEGAIGTTGMMDGDDDDDDDDMTETPALPLVGLLALFGGLLAAARARLRR